MQKPTSANKTQPTDVPVAEFVAGLAPRRRSEAEQLIAMMREISGDEPTLWGPSIIGFGRITYRLASGREEQMALLGFSPRKAALTIYIREGFDRHGDLLDRLGKHRTSVSCLYINKMGDIDAEVLRQLVTRSYTHHAAPALTKPTTVEEYLATVPAEALSHLEELRGLARAAAPESEEYLSYGIIGYRPAGARRAYAFASGFRDHVGIYPVPKDKALVEELEPYRRGKGTLWFPLDEPLPRDLIVRTYAALFAVAP